jgi:hypothetical protein
MRREQSGKFTPHNMWNQAERNVGADCEWKVIVCVCLSSVMFLARRYLDSRALARISSFLSWGTHTFRQRRVTSPVLTPLWSNLTLFSGQIKPIHFSINNWRVSQVHAGLREIKTHCKMSSTFTNTHTSRERSDVTDNRKKISIKQQSNVQHLIKQKSEAAISSRCEMEHEHDNFR